MRSAVLILVLMVAALISQPAKSNGGPDDALCENLFRKLIAGFLVHPQFDEQLAGTRVDSRGNMKDTLSAPWFYKCVHGLLCISPFR